MAESKKAEKVVSDEQNVADKDVASEVTTTSDVSRGYLPAGAKVNVTRDEPSLDPELEKVREQEAKDLSEVKIDTSRPDPSIDEELVKVRDEEIKAAEQYNKQS
jgi:hypothetical protein